MGKENPALRRTDRRTERSREGLHPNGDDPPATPVPAAEVPARPVETGRDWRGLLTRALNFAAAMFLFILAIQLMKRGAQAVAPRLQGQFPVDNMVSTLGLGWLGAYLVLSGSPVAAAALALFAAGATNRLQTFTMLTGSRLGASFIVLLVGFLYAMRSRDRRESIGMGVLALSMTALVYIPGMFLAYGLLKTGLLDGVQWQTSSEVNGVIDAVWGPIVGTADRLVPTMALF